MPVNNQAALANGLRAEFEDTYKKALYRQSDSRVAQVMDLGIGATNRKHEFVYHEAAPHLEYWRRGSTIPTDAFGAVQFDAKVFTYGRRVDWHKEDRKDDQTQGLYDMARMAGNSAAMMPERFLFDAALNQTNTLPAVPNAPDGAAMFSATDGSGAARFGVTGGNLITGASFASVSGVQTAVYTAVSRWLQMQDGKGQPLLAPSLVDQGVLIVHSAADLQLFEQAFLQQRQGIVLGTDAGTTPSNVFQDASRNVDLWKTSRVPTGTALVFMKAPPLLPLAYLNREEVTEYTSLEGDNNSDHTRDTGMEYVQYEMRAGVVIPLPYAAIKITT